MGKTNRVTLHLVAFLLFIGYSLPNFSQRRIVGSVNDMEQKALAYVSVRLLKTDSTYVSGMTTDSLGCYRFANVIYRQAIYFKNLSIPLRVKVARPPVASQKLD